MARQSHSKFLIGVLDQIWDEGSQNFELHLYSETSVSRPYITHKQNGYPYSQLEEIFDATDLLVVPSQWYETFGFTVLEALSYGVPILVGDKVGAQDLINKEFLFRSEDEIEEKIKRLSENREMLIDENACIIEEKRYPFNMDSQVLY